MANVYLQMQENETTKDATSFKDAKALLSEHGYIIKDDLSPE